jgi:hypothetical protein
MKRVLYILIFGSVLAFCKVQQIPMMSSVYIQKIDNLTLEVLADNVNYGYDYTKDPIVVDGERVYPNKEKEGAYGYVNWKTILTNSKSRTIVLDTFHVEKNTTAWRLGEMDGENPFYFYNIINATLLDNTLHIIRQKASVVLLESFWFSKEDDFEKKSKLILHYPVMKAYGKPENSATFIPVKDDLYFYMSIGQEVGNSYKDGVFVLDDIDILKHITFQKPHIRIEDKNQTLKDIDVEKNQTVLRQILKQVLIDNKIIDKKNKFKYIGVFLDYRAMIDFIQINEIRGGISYFLYQSNASIEKMDIIRYDYENYQWLVSDFIEKTIQQNNGRV